MEKIEKNVNKEYNLVKIYLDDFLEIIEILKTEKFENIIITTKDYKLKPEELKDLSENQLSHVNIKADKPYFSIDFKSGLSNKGVRIYSSKDDVKILGIIEKISLILKKNQRKFISFITNLWFTNLLYLFILIFSIVLSSILNNDMIFFFGFGGGILIQIILFFLSSRSNNIIILDYKKNSPNFWIRNKDKIIIAIGSSIFTLFLTYIFKLFS